MDALNKDCSSTSEVRKERINVVDQKKMNSNLFRSRKKIHKCGKCFKKFVKKSNLIIHEELHILEEVNKCNLCKEVFKWASQLKDHLKTSHPLSTIDADECDICKQKFPSTSQLKNHIRTSHITIKLSIGSSERAYECSACEEIFDKYDIETHVQIHMRAQVTENSESKFFKCCVCNKMFQTSLDLNLHSKIHKSDVQSKKLYECSYTYSKLEQLENTARICAGERPYSCKYCDKLFAHRQSWETHEKESHKKKISANTGNSKSGTDFDDCITIMFDCDICQKSFPEKNLMIDHKRIHEEVRSFECNICKITFDQSDDLKFHMRKCHVNEQIVVGVNKILYEFDNCKETFKNDGELDTHLNTYMNTEFTDDCQLSKRTPLQSTQSSVPQTPVNSLAESTQNDLHLIVQNPGVQINPFVVKKPQHFPKDGNLLLQPTQRSVVAIDDFQSSKFVRPMISLSSAENNIVPKIGTQVTIAAVSEISKSEIHDGCSVQEERIDLVQQYECPMVEDKFVSTMKHSSQTAVVKEEQSEPNNESAFQIVQTNVGFQSQTFVRPMISLPIAENNIVPKIETQITAVAEVSKSEIDDDCSVQEDRKDLVQQYEYSKVEDTFASTMEHSAETTVVKEEQFKLDDESALHIEQTNIECTSETPLPEMNENSDSDVIIMQADTRVQSNQDKNQSEDQIFQCNVGQKVSGSRTHKKTKDSSRYLKRRSEGVTLYKCISCRGIFSNIENLRVHLQTEKHKSGCLVYQCNVCQETFRSHASLQMHKKEKHISEQEKYQCDICQKIYRSKERLLEHEKERHRSYQCDICRKMYRSETKLRKHKKERHRSYQCGRCQKIFTSKKILRLHMKDHNVTYECEIWNKKRNLNPDLLNYHVTTNSTNGIRSYECGICKSTFGEKSDVEIHMKFHVDEVTSKCNTSSDALGYETELKRFYCNICHETYSCESELSVHVKTHTAQQLHVCNICNNSYMSIDHLRSHLRIMHICKRYERSVNLFECEICKYMFEEKDMETHINMHMEMKAVEEKGAGVGAKQKFVCHTCQKIFKEKQLLTDHMKVHTKFKQYECGVCKKEYDRSSKLNMHLRKKHVIKKYLISLENDSSYECLNCRKSFKNICDLDLHLKTYVIRRILDIDFVPPEH